MPGRVWTAQGREAIRTAPAVDPTRPLLREHEVAICAHYGIGETGRPPRRDRAAPQVDRTAASCARCTLSFWQTPP